MLIYPLKGGEFMSTIEESLKLKNALIASKMKISESIQPFIEINEAINRSLEPTIQAINNLSIQMNQEIIQQQAEIINNFSAYINDIYTDQMQSIINSIQDIQNSIKLSLTLPELKYMPVIDSFNEFVDNTEFDDSNLNYEANQVKEDIKNNHSLTWDQYLTIILAILSFLMNCASFIDKQNNNCPDEYLKVLNEINANLKDLKSE